jgi:hypothetical protein
MAKQVATEDSVSNGKEQRNGNEEQRDVKRLY